MAKISKPDANPVVAALLTWLLLGTGHWLINGQQKKWIMILVASLIGSVLCCLPGTVIAILSINLGVLNLLPIPILDGGHLLFFLIEGILRKPLGERQRELAQQAGLVLLVGVMIFAFWNDLERIFLR